MACTECFYKINQLPRDLVRFFSIFLDGFLIGIANRRGQAGCYQHKIICMVFIEPVISKYLCNVIDENEKIDTLQLKPGIAK